MSSDDIGRRLRRRPVVAMCLAALLGALCAAAVVEAQRRGGRFRAEVRAPGPETLDGAFQFCRVAFRGNRFGDGGGWGVDYPRADINLPVRLSELTKTPVSYDSGGEPNHFVVQLTDPELFQCPFIMMTEVGSAFLTDEEAASLRLYLTKGGFLWADDFWGSYAWDAWAQQIAKAMPPSEFRIDDLPLTHPLFHVLFEVQKVPQIPSINFWMGSGGGTSERGRDSEVPHARVITDADGRILVLMTHNTDVGDSWEREADDPSYFYRFSVDGYAFGIDVLLYAMSH